MKLFAALLLAGVVDVTPGRACFDECGLRVGCAFAPAEMPATPPAYCEERRTEAAKERLRREAQAARDVQLRMQRALEERQRTATICVEGVRYFERTLTPVYAPRSEPRLALCGSEP